MARCRTPARSIRVRRADSRSIVSTVDRAVVDIDITLAYQSGEAAGTGIVLTDSGLVLTNNHVIDGATAISAFDVNDKPDLFGHGGRLRPQP